MLCRRSASFVAGLEGQPGELRHPVDQAGNLLAEDLADVIERRSGVLDGVVQQGSAERRRVEPHTGTDLCHADRVDNEVLPGATALVGVMNARVHEGVFDLLAVNRDRAVVRVLLDDREEVGK
jgi:hypothetical protein